MTFTSRIIDACEVQLLALAQYRDATPDDAQLAEREIGCMETMIHLAKAGGLSHAGLVEAEKVVAASREWLADLTGNGRER